MRDFLEVLHLGSNSSYKPTIACRTLLGDLIIGLWFTLQDLEAEPNTTASRTPPNSKEGQTKWSCC